MSRSLGRAVTLTAVMLAMCAGSRPTLADPYAATVCEGPPANPSHDGWFSLPDMSWIGTAEELCRALGPAALAVTQVHAAGAAGNTGPQEYTYTCPVGAVPGSCAAVGLSPAPPEPGCSTSDCFCVDEGEGFGVFLTAGTGTTTLTVDGCHTPFVAPVAANTSYLITVAQDAPLVTAADLAAALGLSVGISRGSITRLNCATGVFTTVSAGTPAADGLSLVPGEAYRIRNPSAIAYDNPVDPAVCACTETAYYLITGTGDGTAYAWWLDAGKDEAFVAGESFDDSVAGEPVGATAADLAANLAASIDPLPDCDAAVDLLNPDVVAVTCTPCSFDLWVAPAIAGGTPPFPAQCPVVTETCTYNPDITKIYLEAAGEVETLLVDYDAVPGDLLLSWDASCLVSDTDYAIYEGEIGDWDSHASIACSTGGGTSATITPAPVNSYYLVVPRNTLREGSYGENSAGVPRPQGGSFCAVQEVALACP